MTRTLQPDPDFLAQATGAKVVDVALALGYDSPSAFATMFRRQFDLPPSEFFR